MGVRVISSGAAIPEKRLKNEDLEKIVDTTDEWIITRTGIRERKIFEGSASELAEKACELALKRANVSPSDVELLICATMTPDFPLPSTACVLSGKMKMKCPAFDVSAACTGFIYALAIAEGLSLKFKKILIVCSEILSKFTDYSDRSTCILFGDGAGAVFLESVNPSNLIDYDINADGFFWNLIHIPAGGSSLPASRDTVENKLHFMKMKGQDVFKNAVKNMEESICKLMERNKITGSDIDLFVPHQANLRIINSLRERLNLSEEKVYVNIDRFGNTSAASIPIALFEAEKTGRLKKGDIVLLSAFGAGFTWGSALLRW